MNPFLTASLPNVGPTVSSAIIFAGAGSFPAFNTLDKSVASYTLKFPEITEFPFGISPLTLGAENTLPSKTIAILS